MGTTPRSADSHGRPQRADARRNVASILDAAVACLARDPDASITDIARAAGVGRVTLYGHFSTRADLIEAVLTRTVGHSDAILGSVDTTGDPRDAITRLVAASWQVVDQFRAVLQAAERELPPERIRGTHDRVLQRVRSIIDRGRRAGVFRDDVPVSWLVTTAMSLMHAAADDTTAGRLDPADAAQVITTTLLAAFTPPGTRVPVATT
jgi:TetR/AcrR family transcriptional regulator, mexCD-oprJ operon repressor